MKKTGELLKKARLEKGLSLHEIGLSLKINSKILRAIEENDITQMPAKTFLRGFVQSYAQYLRLNADEVMALFAEEMGSTRPSPLVKSLDPIDVGGLSQDKPASTEVSPLENPKIYQSSEIQIKPFLYAGVIVLLIGLIFMVKRVVDRYQKEAIVSDVVVENPLPATPPLPTTPASDVAQTPGAEKPAVLPQPIETLVSVHKTTPTNPEIMKPKPSDSEAKVQPKPEAKPEAKPDTKPEAKSQTQVETQVPAKVEAKPEIKTGLRVEVKPDSKVEIKDASAARTKPEVKPEVKSEPKSEPKSEMKAENKLDAKQDAKLDSKQETKQDSKLDSKQETKPKPKPVELIVEAMDAVEIEYSSLNGRSGKIRLAADQVHTFKSSNGLKVSIDNGGAVNLILNGKDIGVPGMLGKPLRLSY